jgi:hypothetical protein
MSFIALGSLGVVEYRTVTDPRMIVAEISVNWTNEQGGPPISTRFEEMIAIQEDRGYRLHSFTLHQLLAAPDRMTETIIAVFERVTVIGVPPEPPAES